MRPELQGYWNLVNVIADAGHRTMDGSVSNHAHYIAQRVMERYDYVLAAAQFEWAGWADYDGQIWDEIDGAPRGDFRRAWYGPAIGERG